MSIEILSAGPMLTVQDAGRTGLRHMGVSSAGPIDRAAMALANALAGNSATAAALEFAGPAGRFRSTRAVRFAVAGADCTIRIDDRLVLPGESHFLNPGETLTIGVPESAVWAYLAFSGGVETPLVLGSRSTHLRSGVGGVKGRALKAGDLLPLGQDEPDTPCLRMAAGMDHRSFAGISGPIRVIMGPQHGHFAPEVIARLTQAEFTVTPQRDRMAMVLGGEDLPAAQGHDIVSDGTVPGSVQVPSSGMPLVLLAESQTTGGYPKICTIASVDLARLAQMPVGARFRFAAISRDAGEELWLLQQRKLHNAVASLVPKPRDLLHSEYLLSCDLVGGLYDPTEVVRPVTQPLQKVKP